MAGDAVVLRAQFDSRHVANADNPGFGSFAKDDLLELLRRGEAALRANGVGERLSFGNRFAAHLSRGVDRVLCLDCGDNLGNGDLQLGELVGLDPEAHGVLPGAEYLNRANAFQACELVVQVDVGVVGQEPGIISAFGRVQGDQHQGCEHRFLNGDAEIVDIGGELRRGLRFAALRENQVRIGVRGNVEIDDQPHLPVGGGVEGIHVVHVVDAAHLLLDGSGHRLLDGLGVRANVGCGDLNFGRRNRGELGHRQATAWSRRR